MSSKYACRLLTQARRAALTIMSTSDTFSSLPQNKGESCSRSSIKPPQWPVALSTTRKQATPQHKNNKTGHGA